MADLRPMMKPIVEFVAKLGFSASFDAFTLKPNHIFKEISVTYTTKMTSSQKPGIELTKKIPKRVPMITKIDICFRMPKSSGFNL